MSGSRYAEGTDVAEEASKAELERILKRYGASGYAYLWDDQERQVQIGFKLGARRYRLAVPLPQANDKSITHDRAGYALASERVQKRYEAEVRRRWRVLVLGLKAKLELAAINEGDFTLEKEFLAWAVLQDGRTVSEALEQEQGLLLSGRQPLLLLAAGE
jgi:hypothetical protein